MEQSKFLGPSIGPDESVTFYYGLPLVVSLPLYVLPKNSNMQKLKWVVFGALKLKLTQTL